MNKEKMRAVAWIGDQFVAGPVTGVIITFHGLGDPGLKTVPAYEENEWAAAGGLVVMPYSGPWSWMNRDARSFTDELIGSIYANYGLSPAVPLIVRGASMGGYCALLYTRYSRHPVKACQALFPVCDLKFHFSERPDLPRTIFHAFYGYEDDLDSLFREHSPVDQMQSMPRIPFMIIHGDADQAVNKAAHSDRLVHSMQEHGLKVEYIEVPGMGHHAPLFFDVYRRMIDFVKEMLVA
jgi:dipeptidyl aminopeptidase/acylaminoacyl peptidase